MPTDFEEQVPAQEPQGSSKDEQAREHTNGHDQADAGTAGAATDVVEISIFEKAGADGPLTKVGQLGPDGKPEMDQSYVGCRRGRCGSPPAARFGQAAPSRHPTQPNGEISSNALPGRDANGRRRMSNPITPSSPQPDEVIPLSRAPHTGGAAMSNLDIEIRKQVPTVPQALKVRIPMISPGCTDLISPRVPR